MSKSIVCLLFAVLFVAIPAFAEKADIYNLVSLPLQAGENPSVVAQRLTGNGNNYIRTISWDPKTLEIVAKGTDPYGRNERLQPGTMVGIVLEKTKPEIASICSRVADPCVFMNGTLEPKTLEIATAIRNQKINNIAPATFESRGTKPVVLSEIHKPTNDGQKQPKNSPRTLQVTDIIIITIGILLAIAIRFRILIIRALINFYHIVAKKANSSLKLLQWAINLYKAWRMTPYERLYKIARHIGHLIEESGCKDVRINVMRPEHEILIRITAQPRIEEVLRRLPYEWRQETRHPMRNEIAIIVPLQHIKPATIVALPQGMILKEAMIQE